MNTQAVLSTGTQTTDPPTTIKAARASGYCKLQTWEYGGEQITVKGRVSVVGHHRFDGGNWAEMLQGSGYTFHRPCPQPEGVEAEDRDQIEAKPTGAKEPRLMDALHTIRAYLADKPVVSVHE